MKSPLGRIEMDGPPPYQDRLAALIRAEKPKIVVETGVWAGLSSEFILEAMDANGEGHLFSIDPMDKQQQFNGAQGRPDLFFDNPIVHPRFTLIQKLSHEALVPLFTAVGPFDMFIHDSDHSAGCQTFEYELAWYFVRAGGIIVSDDPFWGTPPHWAWSSFLTRHGLPSGTIMGNAQWVRVPSMSLIKEGAIPSAFDLARRIANTYALLNKEKPYLP
jgi:hypothetical protein